MNSENDLFLLIQSLSKAEKKHFQQSAGRFLQAKNSNYLRVFLALAKMSAFSDQTFRLKTQSIKNLPATMTKLSELILKDLSDIETGKSTTQKLRFLLSCIEITLKKNLKRQHHKLINKAIRTAKKHEQYLILLELNNYRRSTNYLFSQPQPLETLTQIALEDKVYQKACHWETQYDQILKKFKVIRRQWSFFNSPERKAVLLSFQNDPLVNEPVKDDSFLCKIYQEEIRAKLATASKNYAVANAHYQNLSDLWKSHPHRMEAHKTPAMDHYAGLISSMIGLEDFEGAKQGLDEFASFGIKENANNAKQYVSFVYFKLIYLNNCGNYAECHAHIETMTAWIEKHKKHISNLRKIDCYYNSTIFYFLHGEFSEANQYLRRVMQLSKTDVRHDIVDFARVFELVIQFELGHQEIVEDYFRPAYRYYNQRDKLFPYEAFIFKFLQRVKNPFSPKELQDAMRSLRDSVKQIVDHEGSKRPVGSLELQFWLDARLEGVPLREYYTRKKLERAKEKAYKLN